MLIKKTVVLLDEVKTIGHLSVIRVGQETGAKLSLVKALEGNLLIKFSSSPQECFELSGTRMEFMLRSALASNDLIGVLIVDKSGEVLAKGGRADIVNPLACAPKTDEQEVEIVQPVVSKVESKKTVLEQPKEEIEEPKEQNTQNVEQSIEPVDNAIDEQKMDLDSQAENGRNPKGETRENLNPFNFIKGEDFYKNIRGRLAEIMTAHPKEERLESLIPDSKWVKVYYERDEYYVVGILTDEGEVKFLAYGVPGISSVKPPKDAEELCDFLELDGGLGEGYWIMFQNAQNGEIVKSID